MPDRMHLGVLINPTQCGTVGSSTPLHCGVLCCFHKVSAVQILISYLLIIDYACVDVHVCRWQTHTPLHSLCVCIY